MGSGSLMGMAWSLEREGMQGDDCTGDCVVGHTTGEHFGAPEPSEGPAKSCPRGSGLLAPFQRCTATLDTLQFVFEVEEVPRGSQSSTMTFLRDAPRRVEEIGFLTPPRGAHRRNEASVGSIRDIGR